MPPHPDPRIDYQAKYEHPEGETFTERMRLASGRVIWIIIALIVIYGVILLAGFIPKSHQEDQHQEEATPEVNAPSEHEESTAAAEHEGERFVPPLWAVIPFAGLLLCIAVLPLHPVTEHWWHKNLNRFLIAADLGLLTLLYYGLYHPGGIANHFTHAEHTASGGETVFAAFSNAIFVEFIPFIVLLFCLYVISGGISLRGDLPAYPRTNCAFIGIGALLASFIGTTGAAMVLIRPLLSTNAERKYKIHTVIFFIFLVCNCGGLLLPIGDPPLFLGYLRGVPFLWTASLWPYWLGVNCLLLFIYYIWDCRAYKKEEIRDIVRDEREIRPLQLTGNINFIFLLGVVLSVAFIIPTEPLLGTSFVPPVFFREAVMLVMVILSLKITHPHTRVLNKFDYVAIIEVAALFCGIFICMQVPIEILQVKGDSLGINTPVKFFWATGLLSSFLDNAPTYVVFFETAGAMTHQAGEGVLDLVTGGHIKENLLVPISLGAVFMGANTYIGNGPNFMVKSIAEQSGIKMPSFFGYMAFSFAILIPPFILVSIVLAFR